MRTWFFTNFGHNYHFLFFGWKSILRYLRNVSQNIRGLRVPEPPQMGANIYIIISHYNRNYLEKYIVNQKILINKMCLEFNFTYAVQISSRSVNPLSYYIYMKTIIVIISKNKSKNSEEQNVLRIQFYICCTNFVRIGP